MNPEQFQRLEFILGGILQELEAIRIELEQARIDRREKEGGESDGDRNK